MSSSAGFKPETVGSAMGNSVEKLDEAIIPLIVGGRWEEVLFKLTQDMDLWDIDLIELNKRFTGYIKEMKRFDFRVPGKILLTAAIIYRMKAETLTYVETVEQVQEVHDQNGHDYKSIVIPPLQVPLHREPKRRVSLIELISALDKAMVIKDKREARHIFHIDLKGIADGRDITEHIEEIYKKIADFLEREKVITFSQILKPQATKDDKLVSFSSLLHLILQERVKAEQQKIFEEIYIRKMESAA